MSNNKTEWSFEDIVNVSDGAHGIPVYIYVYIILFGFACVVGTVGNIMVIFTVMLTKALRQSRNAFIVNLAVADLMVSSVTMPASIIGILVGRKWYEEKSALCAFTAFFCAPGCVASVYNMAWIAVSRYYYIGQYQLYVKYFTRNKMILYLSSVWLISYAVHLPNHVGWGQIRYSYMFRFCSLDTDLYSYALFYSTTLLVAIATAFVFYFKIFSVLRNSTLSRSMIVGTKQNNGKSSDRGNQSGSSSFSDEVKLAKTSFKIFLLFFASWAPLCIMFVSNVMEVAPPWAYLYAALLAHLNSTLNFFVYFVENEAFRKALFSGLRKYGKYSKRNSVFVTENNSSVRTVAK